MSPISKPEYVRLADHMVHGLVVDMETGWSISGYDVVPYPEEADQGKFVRQKINAGIVEPATAAEYEAAHPAEDEDEQASEAARLVELVKAAAGRGGGQQEHKMRAKHQGSHAAIQRQRNIARLREQGVEIDDDEAADQADAEIEFAVDQARREAIAEDAADNDETNDDPEAQKERSATRAPRKAKK